MNNKLTFSVMWRSTLLWLIVGFVTFIATILSIFLIAFPVKIRHKILSQWGLIFIFLSKHLCKVKVKIIGEQNILKQGPIIIASNHQSMWETAFHSTIFPQHIWILKKEILSVPFFGWCIAIIKPIAIDRKKKLEATLQILKQGLAVTKKYKFSILVFPEGTRAPLNELLPFKQGAAKLALSLQLPILPVSLNSARIMPKKSFWIYPGEVTIVVDKVILPQNFDNPTDLINELERVIKTNFNNYCK